MAGTSRCRTNSRSPSNCALTTVPRQYFRRRSSSGLPLSVNRYTGLPRKRVNLAGRAAYGRRHPKDNLRRLVVSRFGSSTGYDRQRRHSPREAAPGAGILLHGGLMRHNRIAPTPSPNRDHSASGHARCRRQGVFRDLGRRIPWNSELHGQLSTEARRNYLDPHRTDQVTAHRPRYAATHGLHVFPRIQPSHDIRCFRARAVHVLDVSESPTLAWTQEAAQGVRGHELCRVCGYAP
jgi:hypothetical protein